MKKIFSILAVAMLAACAQSQFVAPPVPKSALITNGLAASGGGVFLLLSGVANSNFNTAVVQSVPIGRDGIGITFNIAGTNSASTSNVNFIFQISGDGVNWSTNNDLTVTVTPTTGWNPHYTNILSSTALANLGNASLIRLKTWWNTNIASIFITNITYTTR